MRPPAHCTVRRSSHYSPKIKLMVKIYPAETGRIRTIVVSALIVRPLRLAGLSRVVRGCLSARPGHHPQPDRAGQRARAPGTGTGTPDVTGTGTGTPDVTDRARDA